MILHHVQASPQDYHDNAIHQYQDLFNSCCMLDITLLFLSCTTLNILLRRTGQETGSGKTEGIKRTVNGPWSFSTGSQLVIVSGLGPLDRCLKVAYFLTRFQYSNSYFARKSLTLGL